MAVSGSKNVTRLLRKWSDGSDEAFEELAPIIYAELHKIAKRYMRGEQQNHILQTSALVNEAYLRLIDWENAKWNNRAHFYGVSAQLMRRILVDFARKRPTVGDKEVRQISITGAGEITSGEDLDVVALHEALEELAKIDERKAKIVELKFFGGSTVDEIAAHLNIAPITVMRDWKTAKAWLFRELSK